MASSITFKFQPLKKVIFIYFSSAFWDRISCLFCVCACVYVMQMYVYVCLHVCKHIYGACIGVCVLVCVHVKSEVDVWVFACLSACIWCVCALVCVHIHKLMSGILLNNRNFYILRQGLWPVESSSAASWALGLQASCHSTRLYVGAGDLDFDP